MYEWKSARDNSLGLLCDCFLCVRSLKSALTYKTKGIAYALFNLCCDQFLCCCLCSTTYNSGSHASLIGQMPGLDLTRSAPPSLRVIRWKTSQPSVQRISGRDPQYERNRPGD